MTLVSIQKDVHPDPAIAVDLALAADEARLAVALAPDDAGKAAELASAVRAQREAVGIPSPSEWNNILAETAEAASELRSGDMQAAEVRLRAQLRSFPRDTAAMRLMALIALRSGFAEDAERILRRARDYAPGEVENTLALAAVLRRQSRLDDALRQLDDALPGSKHVGLRILRGSLLLLLGRSNEAEAVFDGLVRDAPLEKAAWVNLGYLAASVGKLGRAVAAYRTAVAIDPALGAGWLGLANLKRVRLHDDDISAMRNALDREDLSREARAQTGFALGAALDQQERTEEAFAAYATANRVHRTSLDYSDAEFDKQATRLRAELTGSFFNQRWGWGSDRSDPIFIVGMTRSGSTLLEQILASHPSIEGADELKILHGMATQLAGSHDTATLAGALDSLTAEDAKRLGEEYLEKAAQWRRTDRPHFTDKMPSNWIYAGFIQLILPHAKIVDIRRHPLDCSWSNYTQYIQHGMAHTCDLAELGAYYRRYVETMAHFDQALPGRVYRIHHEDLIADPEDEIRKLLNHLALPFDPACLAFPETRRAIFTPSAQQVRAPINRSGVGRWRRYEDQLGPLKKALGDILTLYPAVPERAKSA